jgi:hypothetical protein
VPTGIAIIQQAAAGTKKLKEEAQKQHVSYRRHYPIGRCFFLHC